ncbi:MAG TPA: DNA polymerase Y family protein, partial [Rhodocyclaceae bacterium]|nr:DNA polymerase Y family protein [Rhodocyclaceae bacterium]
MTIWLALHLPALPLQVCTRAEHAAEIPLAVFSSAPRSRLVAANARALAAGLRPGLGLASALALAPGLVVRLHDPAGEAALLAELACWAAQFSPQLALDPPDCVVLDVGASLTLFGGLHELMARIAHGVASLGLQPALA